MRTAAEWKEENAKWLAKDEARVKALASRVVNLIQPPMSNRAQYREYAFRAIWQMEEHVGALIGKNYISDVKMKNKLYQFAVAVRRLGQSWTKICNAQPVVLPVAMPASFPDSLNVVLEFGLLCEKAAGEIKTKDRMSDREADRKRKDRVSDADADRKRAAVRCAFRLVTKAGKKPVAYDEKSLFCLVAKMLHGGGVDLVNQCKLMVRATKAKKRSV
jgi:hypothetical protein